MAASYYYIKAGGSASGATEDNNDGVYSTAKTGTWATAFSAASQYFDSLEDVMNATHAVANGDTICISDASSDTWSTVDFYYLPAGVLFVTVDDDDVTVYTPATSKQQDCSTVYSVGSTSAVTDPCVIAGFNLEMNHDWGGNQAGSSAVYRDCTHVNTNDTRTYTFNAEAAHFLQVNNSWGWSSGTASGEFTLGGIGHHLMFGDTFSPGSGITDVFNGGVEGGRSYFVGCDLSAAPSSKNLMAFNASTTKNHAILHFVGCKLPSAWTVSNEDVTSQNILIAEACESKYQYSQHSRPGIVDFVTDVSYDSHDTLDDGTTQGSYEFETNANVGHITPLTLGSNVLARYLSAINTEAATKKKVRLRFVTASGDTLDDGDITAIVIYPNSSTTYRFDVVEHWKPEIQAGATLSTETGNWTGSGLGTQYYLDVDMGSPGNGRVMVIPGICKPSVTVYVSWQLEFVA